MKATLPPLETELQKLLDSGKLNEPEIKSFLAKQRQQRVLTTLANEIGKQLGDGTIDRAKLGVLLARVDERKPAVALSSVKGLRRPPSGQPIPGLPKFSHAIGGVFGLIALAGETGAGKSTLALQISVGFAEEEKPVLYVDFENGDRVLKYHLEEALGEKKAGRISQFIHVVEGVEGLHDNIERVDPALVVVDSIQSLPFHERYRRSSVDGWIREFEQIAKSRRAVLMLSEKSRATYGEASVTGFKESGEVEYKAWVGVQMVLSDPEDVETDISLHVVKNRHRPRKPEFFGRITFLERDPRREFWFRETKNSWKDA